MIKVDCTYCEKPVKDVFYQLLAKATEDPTRTVSGQGGHLHYDCVPLYFGWLPPAPPAPPVVADTTFTVGCPTCHAILRPDLVEGGCTDPWHADNRQVTP